MSAITDIKAREIIDSRGNPTIEADVYLETGAMGRFAVPSGASTGIREALELRDKDKERFHGKGVMKGVNNVNGELRDLLIGMESYEQREIDDIMIGADGTENKSRLGANAILGVSMACAKATANELGMPLYRYIGGCNTYTMPLPMANVINGGEHADNNLDVQEYMLMPTGASSIKEAIRMVSETFHTLKDILNRKKLSTGVGDEGGFAPMLNSNEEALDILVEAIGQSGYEAGRDMHIALDVAASSFAKKDKYTFEGKEVSSAHLIDIYSKWIDKYPVISIEDGLGEEDWEGWRMQFERMGSNIQLVGDDIFVTNVKLLQKGIEENAANSILIKLNQIGTLSETIDAVTMAKNNKWTAVISHRSGETADSTIADLSVALNTGFIKTGSMSRGERTEKYNQLIRIEEELPLSLYRGIDGFYNLR